MQMIPAQLVDALEMMGKDSGSTLDPTRVFYYSAFTPEGRLLWRVQLMWQEARNFLGDSVTSLLIRRGPG
ncbi:hypothetical protein HanRHA438_Chr10g0471981 [Helianthus annuus]|uniref:Uncharacterized protein n=1 Tax=Helianthus annuus TaxID=4232 RepID=A0A251TP55_HELAN|nr:hypothetical protein HanXRQr2_Chr10g0459201 [Helianthus annuus]KAJ0523525.1 hypothetical protein HanIR_Chr10g0494831 [Helianthus annuus]KAJ0881219.1 hypothetical protein HanRHA438_Chr10g0471981 [Helianthus annuus]KAJ0885252.1 hypothetical protein HanPSC8_Chr10g0443241 [Helianthus annuus]